MHASVIIIMRPQISLSNLPENVCFYGNCVYFPIDVSLKEFSCEKKFSSTSHKYYDLYFCDKIKKIRAITHRIKSKWNFLSPSFQFRSLEMRRTAVGFIKFGLLSRDSVAEKRMWLHQRGTGKGVVEEEEATWWKYQAITGCDKQNNVDNGRDAWLWDEVSLLFACYLMELRFLTTLSWITGNLITDLTFTGNVRWNSNSVCCLGWRVGERRKSGQLRWQIDYLHDFFLRVSHQLATLHTHALKSNKLDEALLVTDQWSSTSNAFWFEVDFN